MRIVNYSMNQKPFPFLSVREVAVASDLSVPNIYKHIGLGHIEVIKLRDFKNYMIPAASLAAFLRARAEGKFKRPAKRPDKVRAKKPNRDQDKAITLTVKG
jgi:hypothetical protein